MNIPEDIIKELKYVEARGIISNPTQLLFVGCISKDLLTLIGTRLQEVFISKISLKHIFDQRGNEQIIYEIASIVSKPNKIIDNSNKRPFSFIFVKMNGKAKGVVVEVTKTPDGNRVVSAFPIDKKTYKKLKDISGRSDVPP